MKKTGIIGISLIIMLLATSISTGLNTIKTNHMQQHKQTMTMMNNNIALYILSDNTLLMPAREGAVAKYKLRVQKSYEGVDTAILKITENKNILNFYINGIKTDESNPYEIELIDHQPVDFTLVIELKNTISSSSSDIVLNITSKTYKEATDEAILHCKMRADFPIILEKTKDTYKTNEKITFKIKNTMNYDFKYDYSEFIILDTNKKIISSYKEEGDTIPSGEEKTIETHFTMNNEGDYIILAVLKNLDDGTYSTSLNIKVKKTRSLSPTPKPWGWVWMGILKGDWSKNESTGGIDVEISYKIVAIGYHHIEVNGDYLLS
ncbi:MAG: hypothetical protein DRJ99_01925, partial [Thermoplasmata archaeon]